ncbi:alpha/beta hydrolase [Nocardioides campestrisoli]|uniref:alpha/beta hydrolase n=1 Tax=Nocardioides campestrisoli TaxID=2736757 RepID=UPI0015E73FF5|nr:alpha/beta hydrolase [Nocardioides campestrisoli]
MTVTIPVPAPLPPVTRPEGDPGMADSLAERLYTTASRFEEFGDTAASAKDGAGVWFGQAFEAYRGAASRASGEHASMAATVKRVAHGVTAYADTLRDLLRSYEQLRDRRTALHGQRDDLISDIESTLDPTPQILAALRSRATHLAARMDDWVTDRDAWLSQVQAAEDLVRRTFESATDLGDALSDLGGVSDTARDAMGKPGAPGPDSSPEQVADWWDGLTDAEREAVTAAYPSVIGSANGLPAGARDDANRVLLDGDLARLGAKEEDGTIDPAERKVLENARETEKALSSAEEYEDPLGDGKPGAQLWLYDPTAFDGDGRVAVAVGDLDTARDVAVFTPGITTDMSKVGGYTGQMYNLYESTRYNGDGSSVATMFWLGYDAPDGPIDPATATEGRAEDGGRRLADAVDGLRASRGDDPAHLTAIGHSYGSTTTSYATGEFDLAADDVVLVGSPGAGPADDAGDFSVGRDHVFVGRDSRDIVAVLGDEGWMGKGGIGLGRDPSSDDFGAVRFEAERVDREDIRNWDAAHSNYLSVDTESLYNIGLIVDGHGDEVNRAEHSYDPWWDLPRDPEIDREPTSGVPGRSQTRGME